MLHNPNWNKSANDVSMDDFIGWLESKDPNEAYDYQNKCGDCCIGQYMAARGILWPKNGWEFVYKDVCTLIFGGWIGDPQLVLGGGFNHRDQSGRTFGAVLRRTKAYKEKRHG
jgi:hypothetical protein